ncbi:F-box protein [Sporobolomyces salmoneus]|uniref:F-box protein n=1 Tax=Sporobolomyces salmoneus TaxID=183962 RepID=UPI00316BAC7A
MPVPPLPNELVDQILSYDWLKQEDLYRTATVSSRWSRPSIIGMYQGIRVVLLTTSHGDDERREGAERYRYSQPTWQLLLRLSADPNLRPLVKHITFQDVPLSAELRPTELKLSEIATSREDAVSTFMRLTPNATSFGFENDEWIDSERFGCFHPYAHRVEQLSIRYVHGLDWFGSMAKFPKLRSIYLSGDLPFPPFADGALECPLEEIAIEDDHLARVLTEVVTGSENSLRHLMIPFEFLNHLKPSTYPNLARLSLASDGNAYLDPDFEGNLAELQQAKNLAVIDIHSSITGIHHIMNALRCHLPPSCTRVNIVGPISFEMVLAIVGKSNKGHRIRQLGLPALLFSHPTENADLFCAGIRAIVEQAGVELIRLAPRNPPRK